VSNHVSEPADVHPIDELAPLLAGELALDELRAVVVHVRGCAVCQAELVEVAAGYGALQGVALEGLTDLPEPPPLAVHPIEAAPVRPMLVADDDGTAAGAGGGSGLAPRPTSAGGRAARLLATAAAAVLLVLGGVVIGTRIEDGGGQIATPATTTTTLPLATVVLDPQDPEVVASGSVSMYDVAGSAGSEQIMTVDTAELPPAEPGTFYEVWLLQPDTGQMLAVGVLPDSGSASFAIPADIVANYQAVDISRQPDDGGLVHSGDSVLRATYA
jgi:hypothetical protein